jgi:hypothetical protein
MDDEDRLSFQERRVGAPFEVRWVTIEPGSERTCDGAEWLDALVVLELGSIELECPSGISRSFEAGGVLCLSRLSRGTLRNRGPDLVILAVVSRRRPDPANRSHRADADPDTGHRLNNRVQTALLVHDAGLLDDQERRLLVRSTENTEGCLHLVLP